MLNIEAQNYYTIYTLVFTLPVIWIFISKVGLVGNKYLLEKQSQLPTTIFTLLIILFVGFRPLTRTFCDMIVYDMDYQSTILSNVTFDWNSEWLWTWIMMACKSLGFTSSAWFAIIEFFYIGCIFFACKKLIGENVFVPMLFFLSSYTFFAYGVNTIRSGMAGSVVILALAFLVDGKKNYWIAVLLMLAAFGIHRSTIISIGAICASFLLIKSPKQAICIWLLCIILSLLAGSSLMSLFNGIEFDDRIERYTRVNEKASQMFSHTGFRWDFLLYSSVPVFVTWFVTEVKNTKDAVFNLIANTYILANAVWVICIRANYSDRFAHLSWFIYPLVIAYAFVRLPLFKNQDSAMSWVLLCFAGFTVYMSFVLGK